MDRKRLNAFINTITENVLNKINENEGWVYNNINVDPEELDNFARDWAENYWYDTQNGQRPQSQMNYFREQYGESDGDFEEYEGVLNTFFELCEKYKEDPDIQAKYSDDYIDPDNIETPEDMDNYFKLSPGTTNVLMALPYFKYTPSGNYEIGKSDRLNLVFDFLTDIESESMMSDYSEFPNKVRDFIANNTQSNESKSKLTDKIIKETIIKPIVEKYLREAEMGFATDDINVSQDITDKYHELAYSQMNDEYGENEETDNEIDEATASGTGSGGVGDFSYDAPAFGADKETTGKRSRTPFSGGMRENFDSFIKNIVENSLKKSGLIKEDDIKITPKVIHNHWVEALKNPEKFNDQNWIEKNNYMLSNISDNAKTSLGPIIKRLINPATQNNPDLLQSPGFKRALSVLKGGVGNPYGDKHRGIMVDMDRQLMKNPELSNDEEFMSKYNDLVQKYGVDRVALPSSGKNMKVTAGISRNIVSVVDKLYQRALNYIVKLYKDSGLEFNKGYPYPKSDGGIDNKTPAFDWEGLKNDFYENFGLKRSKGGYVELTPEEIKSAGINLITYDNAMNIYDTNDDKEFMMNIINSTGDDSLSDEDIIDKINFFKDQVRTAEKRRENAGRSGNVNFGGNLSTGGNY